MENVRLFSEGKNLTYIIVLDYLAFHIHNSKSHRFYKVSLYLKIYSKVVFNTDQELKSTH